MFDNSILELSHGRAAGDALHGHGPFFGARLLLQLPRGVRTILCKCVPGNNIYIYPPTCREINGVQLLLLLLLLLLLN